MKMKGFLMRRKLYHVMFQGQALLAKVCNSLNVLTVIIIIKIKIITSHTYDVLIFLI